MNRRSEFRWTVSKAGDTSFFIYNESTFGGHIESTCFRVIVDVLSQSKTNGASRFPRVKTCPEQRFVA